VEKWVGRDAALSALGVKPQTLYAYVSRGLLSASPDPDDPRRSLYLADDVAALANRRKRGRSRSAVAAGSIAWGDPVLETAISTVSHGRLLYRGEDAAQLAPEAAFEEVASLLIGQPVQYGAGTKVGSGLPDLFLQLARASATGRSTLGRSTASLAREAAQLVPLVAAAFGATPPGPIHEAFARLWDRPEASDAIRRALVLMADHELNASTFAARVAASTGASLAACLLAGLATLSGPHHGAATNAVYGLIEDAQRQGAAGAIDAHLTAYSHLPGFGHALYIGIDVRAETLLASFELPTLLDELIHIAQEETGHAPNIDFATVAMALAFDLPAKAPLSLFAVARSAGWLAHAIEQVGIGKLIRPRARYIGKLPRAR